MSAAGQDEGAGRAGTALNRRAVQEAAAQLFAEQGFAATGVRDIARQARVDPALVIRYFGSKEKLFVHTMTMSDAFLEVTQGPLAGLGRTLVDFVVRRTRLRQTGTAAAVFAALVRASDRPAVREHLQEAIEQMIIAPLAPRLGGDDPELRAHLLAAQLSGLMNALYVVESPWLLEAPIDAIVDCYGDALQTIIDGSSPPPNIAPAPTSDTSTR
ncbi:TetR/AcrR family transcriptional regulator [Rhodococcus sp. AQ5-07]|uniref:TetR/AcrR family transcriptional regulator n=1 Tax=Rhodococcus sp. AQ5-07 TaxID=2054902 RepID=UPI000DBFB007|nr:TetR family transcriptional regulator [Rhodococcus sp. AQ5-07]RAL31786.1 TetR/AcrR family transcriptional regulator [Rhodococcus sp. AQ5-07]